MSKTFNTEHGSIALDTPSIQFNYSDSYGPLDAYEIYLELIECLDWLEEWHAEYRRDDITSIKELMLQKRKAGGLFKHHIAYKKFLFVNEVAEKSAYVCKVLSIHLVQLWISLIVEQQHAIILEKELFFKESR